MNLEQIEKEKKLLSERIKSSIEQFHKSCTTREIDIYVESTYQRGVKSSELISVDVQVLIRLND